MTPKQQRFVKEYLIDLNATQAAIRAGYSQRTAEQIGHQLLKKTSVAEAIREATLKRAIKLEITAEKVLGDLEDARRNAMATMEWGPAIRACELQGKHIGMFVDRSETVITERMVVRAPEQPADADDWRSKHGPH